jgi:hypothetical protein
MKRIVIEFNKQPKKIKQMPLIILSKQYFMSVQEFDILGNSWYDYR